MIGAMKQLAFVLLFCLALPCLGARVTISLDGTWDIADSLDADQAPASYTHKTPVPGLAHSSTPPFADVDLFDSRELIVNRVGRGDMPRSAIVRNAGVPRQNRNYFWYRTSFTPDARRAVAILKINKAQFGTAVWLNGKKIGDHFGCFTAGIFNISDAIKWDGPNELVVRIGAHPAVLPPNVNGGTDFEKNRWTPGIYDSVSVALSDNPVIETIQVAPRIQTSEITVQTQIRNYGAAAVTVALKHVVRPWKQGQNVAAPKPQRVTIAAGETKTVTGTVKVPGAKLWSPEEPNLYVLETSTGGDSVTTRFGMREFRFDTATRRAYLNGKPYFMRGSNITMHRFFEDPLSGTLPWDEKWVRKLLVEIPHRMNWNSFRFCIGPVPDRWLEIADEAGLLIQNEYFFWIGHGWHGNDYTPTFDADTLIAEFKEWMRDNWNHASVVIWDANNESWYPDFTTKIIPAVRGLDLSNRPWENSYNGPAGPDDPVEDHPYEHQAMANGKEFEMSDLESRVARPGQTEPPTAHALILNEYGWLWLNRDGSPTELTNKLYPRLLGPNSTPEQRLALNAYLLAGLTEFWRAHRQYAAVLHFVYLTMSDPKGFTCDHFRDIVSLKLDPYFEDYMSEAFKPLGVYINFFQPTLEADSARTFTVMMVNDDSEPVRGSLALSLENEKGEAVAQQSQPFSVGALGQETVFVDFKVPSTKGKFLLKATARPEGTRHKSPTVSRRRVEVQ